MLSQLLGHSEKNIIVSGERIEELFKVPKTNEKWKNLVENKNFQRMMVDTAEDIQKIIGFTLSKDQIIKTNFWESKVIIMQYGLFFVANEGISLNKGMQKGCEFVLKEIEAASEEEIEEIIQEYFEILFEETLYRNNNDSPLVYTETLM